MSLLDLGALYLLGGVACAAGMWRKGSAHRTPSSLLTALFLWPLWAPFVFSEGASKRGASRVVRRQRAARRRERRSADSRPQSATRTQRATQLLELLEETLTVARGTPFAAMLNAHAAERISAEVHAACERLEELDVVLAEPEFDPVAASSRVEELEGEGASASSLGAARMHLQSVRRLVKLREVQAAAWVELEQALAALHSQLVVAHYAGSTSEGVSAIVSDLWARVEGLGEALEPESQRPVARDTLESPEPRVGAT